METKFTVLNIEKDCKITPTDVILGRFKQPKYDLFNHAILHAKYFIHICYIMKKSLNIDGFINYYKHILLIEKQRCVEKVNLADFNFRFGKCLLVRGLSL